MLPMPAVAGTPPPSALVVVPLPRNLSATSQPTGSVIERARAPVGVQEQPQWPLHPWNEGYDFANTRAGKIGGFVGGLIHRALFGQ